MTHRHRPPHPPGDSARGIVGACGPKSPGSHRVVWGLISRPPVPVRAFLRFPVCPAEFFPVVRLLPVSLRPAFSGSVPVGFPPVSFPSATSTLALPRSSPPGIGPVRPGPRSPVPAAPWLRWRRSARTIHAPQDWIGTRARRHLHPPLPHRTTVPAAGERPGGGGVRVRDHSGREDTPAAHVEGPQRSRQASLTHTHPGLRRARCGCEPWFRRPIQVTREPPRAVPDLACGRGPRTLRARQPPARR